MVDVVLEEREKEEEGKSERVSPLSEDKKMGDVNENWRKKL